MKSFKKLVTLISLAFLTAIFASNFTSAYADSTTKVNITNVDIASLSNSEKELIISGKPSGAANSTTSVKLVYKKVACPIDKPSLPNTGTSTSLVTLGAGILVLGAAYALLKSNKGKKLITILFFVVGVGSILVGSVDASQVTLNGETKVVSISQLEEITVDEIDCYEYVEYIIVKGDETTTVTTESGTTETPTTEAPTTEGPTTDETTTEETTEETTTEQTESEEEVTIKPGTPAPA